MSEERFEALSRHINAAYELPMEWGSSDCTSWAAAWVEVVHERPVKRPEWHSAVEAHALIDAAGSLKRLWADVLDDYGLGHQIGAPQPGDIGIIETRVAGPVGGIFIAGGRFAWRAEPLGLRVILPRQIIACWAV